MARWEDSLDALTDILRFWHSDMGKRYARGFVTDREDKIREGTYRKALAELEEPTPPFAEGLKFDFESDPSRIREKAFVESIGMNALSNEEAIITPTIPTAELEARKHALGLISREPPDIYQKLDQRMSAMIFNSDPIWIEKEMWQLVLAAAESWQGEALHETDLPTPAGFMLLPEPFHEKDVWGKIVSVRAINWHPMTYNFMDATTNKTGRVEQGLLLAFYHYTGDPDEYTVPGEANIGHWLLSHASPWIFDKPDPTLPKYPGFDLGMTLQVCWRLMQQEVSLNTERVAGGQFRNRAERMKIEPKVTVVTLRRARPDPDYASTHHTEWTRQWIVSGHWRNQWYSSLSIHRLIWIAPFVKGPPDKPLIVKKVRAFQWTR